MGSVIEILVLQALADRSLAPLERALTLAEPEGYVRVFTGVGPAMLNTLGRQHPYARLLAAVDSPPPAQVLVDPLSDRELDVLRLLATDLDGPDIARRLSVSVTTVRTHTQHIYAKLGVNNRRAAVRQARQLNLLPRG
jgi:LuxR family maltose regulon positive regulatory protein